MTAQQKIVEMWLAKYHNANSISFEYFVNTTIEANKNADFTSHECLYFCENTAGFTPWYLAYVDVSAVTEKVTGIRIFQQLYNTYGS